MGSTRSEIEKIGNTLIYLQEKIGDKISKTKAIKLLYFLEEFSMKRYNKPFLNLEWEVWHLGPVSEEIYAEINDPYVLSDHIVHSHVDGISGCFITAKHEFVDDEFSDADIELMDLLIKELGHLNAADLIERTHQKNTLWYKIAKEKDLLESFNNRTLKTTDHKINLSDLLSEENMSVYKSYIENKETSKLYAV